MPNRDEGSLRGTTLILQVGYANFEALIKLFLTSGAIRRILRSTLEVRSATSGARFKNSLSTGLTPSPARFL